MTRHSMNHVIWAQKWLFWQQTTSSMGECSHSACSGHLNGCSSGPRPLQQKGSDLMGYLLNLGLATFEVAKAGCGHLDRTHTSGQRAVQMAHHVPNLACYSSAIKRYYIFQAFRISPLLGIFLLATTLYYLVLQNFFCLRLISLLFEW